MIQVPAIEVRRGDMICGADGEQWHQAIWARVKTRPRPMEVIGLTSGRRAPGVTWMRDDGLYAVENAARTFLVSRPGR